MMKLKTFCISVLAVMLFAGSVLAQDGDLDPTFNPVFIVTPQYQIFDIGIVQTGDSASQAFGISTGGVAVGRSIRSGAAQAYTWTLGGGIVGLPNLAGRAFCVSNSANDSGIIVGTCSTTAFGSGRLPTIWQNGVVSQLPLPAGETLGDANDVNASGVAVGSVNGGSAQRGAIYSGGTGTVITQTTSNGSFYTTAFGINDSGRVVGPGIDPNNAARNVPMVYDIGSGSAIDIGALPGLNGAIAFGVGNGGHVVGSSMLNQGSGLPFIWTQSGGMVAIPLVSGTSQGSARAVNSAGWVVGTDGGQFAVPFLYDGTASYRLADLIPAGTGWDLSMNTSSSAFGISDNNVIVGTGVLNGQTHAYAMVPVTPTPTPTPTATPTPTPTPTPGNVCTPITTVTEGDIFPGGIVSFGVTSGPGSVTIDHVNAGTGLQSLTVVGVPVNAVVNIPAFTPGTTAPVVVTFTTPMPGMAVDFTLRAASTFHAANIRVRCAETCTPVTTVTEGDLFPGGVVSFGVTSGPGSVTVDHVNAGTGLQSLTVVGVPMNATVNIPPFTPGTFNPTAVFFTPIDPNQPVDFTLRAASSFHAIFIRVRCGTPPPINSERKQ